MNHETDLAADRKKILPFLAKHYLKLVMYSVITMPAWIAKQLLCYPAGLDVEMDKSKIILDIRMENMVKEKGEKNGEDN